MTSAKPQGHRPAKTSRIELRATEDDRSSFLLAQGRLAALRVLADREQFVLDGDGQKEWERINSRPALALRLNGMSGYQPPVLLAGRHHPRVCGERSES